MKPHRPFDVVLGAVFAQTFALEASAAPITVNSTVTWDGICNPHAAEENNALEYEPVSQGT